MSSIVVGPTAGPIGSARAQAPAPLRSPPIEVSRMDSAPAARAPLDARARRAAVAIGLYRELARGHGNVFASPYSLEMVLAMAQAGARGNMGRAFAEVLGSEGSR